MPNYKNGSICYVRPKVANSVWVVTFIKLNWHTFLTRISRFWTKSKFCWMCQSVSKIHVWTCYQTTDVGFVFFRNTMCIKITFKLHVSPYPWPDGAFTSSWGAWRSVVVNVSCKSISMTYMGSGNYLSLYGV